MLIRDLPLMIVLVSGVAVLASCNDSTPTQPDAVPPNPVRPLSWRWPVIDGLQSPRSPPGGRITSPQWSTIPPVSRCSTRSGAGPAGPGRPAVEAFNYVTNSWRTRKATRRAGAIQRRRGDRREAVHLGRRHRAWRGARGGQHPRCPTIRCAMHLPSRRTCPGTPTTG